MDLLARFNIPSTSPDPTVRNILSSLLTARALTLGELQIARDIIARRPTAKTPDSNSRQKA